MNDDNITTICISKKNNNSIIFDLSSVDKHLFKQACLMRNTDASKALRQFVIDYILETAELDPQYKAAFYLALPTTTTKENKNDNK